MNSKKESNLVTGYTLQIKHMNPKDCSIMIHTMDDKKFCKAVEKHQLYLVDALNTLENEGVDPYEMEHAVQEMTLHGHNTAHFGMMGSFISSKYEKFN